MKLQVDVDLDELAEESRLPVIVGPGPGDRTRSWCVYLPDDVGCLCSTFDDAVEVVRDWLKPRPRRKAKR